VVQASACRAVQLHGPGDWPFAIVPLVKISLDFFAEIL
jgi:hypothetical protein